MLTNEQKLQVIDAVAGGMTYEATAAYYRLTRSQVAGVLGRWGKRLRPDIPTRDPHRPSKWDADMVSRLRGLIKSGATHEDAAAELDTTIRGITKAITKYAPDLKRRTIPARVTPIRSHREPSQTRFIIRSAPRPARSLPPAEPTSATNVTLLDLTQTTCRWPINDGGPWIFCGSADGTDNAAGRCYCRYHARKAGRIAA